MCACVCVCVNMEIHVTGAHFPGTSPAGFLSTGGGVSMFNSLSILDYFFKCDSIKTEQNISTQLYRCVFEIKMMVSFEAGCCLTYE